MVRIGAFRVFMITILNIEPYSPQKPTKVGFIFIGPNSLRSSRRSCRCQSRDTNCCQSWVLKSSLRNYDSRRRRGLWCHKQIECSRNVSYFLQEFLIEESGINTKLLITIIYDNFYSLRSFFFQSLPVFKKCLRSFRIV